MDAITESGVEIELSILLPKLSLVRSVTLQDVKEAIWNEQDSSELLRLIVRLTEQETDQAFTDEAARIVQNAWNVFPHRKLGGKSPKDLVEMYARTGAIEKEVSLPSKGKTQTEIFSDGFPSTVQFVDLGETWGFQYPKSYFDYMEQASELEESSVSAKSRDEQTHTILMAAPELFDITDALARSYENRRQLHKARELYETAIKRARGYIPSFFTPGLHHIIWAYLDNRPFLRLLAGYAQFLERHDGIAVALPYYEELLGYNPSDNQGIRGILATAYLTVNRPNSVVQLSALYPNDTTPELIMGTVLALYQQKPDHTEAKKFLVRHGEYQQHVVRELLKSHHLPPIGLEPGRVRRGGSDEAYYYWEAQGRLWQDTKGALKFLADQLPAIAEHAVVFTDHDLLQVDMFRDIRTFLQELEQRPLKLTAAGNLSFKDLGDLLPRLRTVQPVIEYLESRKWSAKKEEDVRSLHLVRILSGLMKLTRKKGTLLYLTKKGKLYLAAEPAVQYSQIVLTLWYRLNWLYLHPLLTPNMRECIRIMQQHQQLIWGKLLSYGHGWIEYEDFCHWASDELELKPYLKENFSDPAQMLLRNVERALFTYNLEVFGCVETEGERAITRFRSTPLGLCMYSLGAA